MHVLYIYIYIYISHLCDYKEKAPHVIISKNLNLCINYGI